MEQLSGFNLAYMHFISTGCVAARDKAPDVIDGIDRFLKACKTVSRSAGYIDSRDPALNSMRTALKASEWPRTDMVR
jgi:hypothetical protein